MQPHTKGQSIVEVLVAISVMTLCVAAVGAMMLDAQRSTMGGLMRLQATYIAEEGIEAARAIRDGGFSGLTTGVHGVALVGGRFELADTSDTEEQFTRTVEIEDISSDIKRVTSSVSWNSIRQAGDRVEVVADLRAR